MNDIEAKMRMRIENWLMGKNTINQLLTDKVNAYTLMEELPISFDIGKYKIYVGNLTIENNYKFWDSWALIMANIGLKAINFDMLSDGGELYRAIMLHRRLYKDLCKLIHKTICKQQFYYMDQISGERKSIKIKNISLRYFIKNMSIEKLIQMCFMVYLYNFDAEKKNSQVINFKLAKDGKQTMETYMSYYYLNMPGLIGKFALPHSIRDVPFLNEDSIETIPIMAGPVEKSPRNAAKN